MTTVLLSSLWISIVVIVVFFFGFMDAHEDYQTLVQPDLIESDCVTKWNQMGTYFFQELEEDSKQNILPFRPLAFEQTPSILFVNLTVQVGHFDSHYVDFNTRSYNGKIPAPTIKVCPGDKLIIRVKNTLAEGDLNVTNVHLHGLHVSPEGHADNVLANILPGEERVYEYNIRNDHPPGTFWYHPHSHGYVNTQLSGMMAGALIIADRPGNFPHELAQMDDLVMVLQAICVENCHTMFDDLVQALTNSYSKNESTHRQTSTQFPVDLEIEDTGSPLNDTSLLHVYVNGQYQPELHMKPHEFKRFRYVNAIANNLVELVVPECEMYLLGMDGIYRKSPIQKEVIVLPPGGRADVAVKCRQEKGAYFVEIQADPKRNHLLGQKHRVTSQKIISLRVVGEPAGQGEMLLPRALPQKPQYMTDLLYARDISRHYDYEFSAWTFENSTQMHFGVNQMSFNESFVNHTLQVDQPEEWTLSTKMYGPCSHPHMHTVDQSGASKSADPSSSTNPPHPHCNNMNHPFHIHGTHYQITKKRLDFDPDNILYELGEWRDTVPLYDTQVHIRFTPRRHMVGKIMSHCHVASHADAGMAQLVQVVQY